MELPYYCSHGNIKETLTVIILWFLAMTECRTSAGRDEEHMTCGVESWAVERAFWVTDLDMITWEGRGERGREGVSEDCYYYIIKYIYDYC